MKGIKGNALMAETSIEWTDATWNPVVGCSIVSAGCSNCYAMEMARRLEAMGIEKYRGLTRRTGKRTAWNGIIREDAAALNIPLQWKRPSCANTLRAISLSVALAHHKRNSGLPLSKASLAADVMTAARQDHL
jgi:protein gp37